MNQKKLLGQHYLVNSFSYSGNYSAASKTPILTPHMAMIYEIRISNIFRLANKAKSGAANFEGSPQ